MITLMFIYSNMFLVSSFGESCSLDIQCYNVTRGAICATIKQSQNDTTNIMESDVNTENKVCTCSKEDHYRFGRCFKKKCKTE